MPHRRLADICFALAAAVLLAGLARGGGDGARNRIPRPLRMLSSALVWAGALLLWRGAPAGERRGRAGLAAAGMGFGFLGDLIMARVIPLPQHVIFGMLAFGAGHVQYLRAAGTLPPEHEGTKTRRHEGAQARRKEEGESILRACVPSCLRGKKAALAGAAAAGAGGWRLLAYAPVQPAPINAASLVYALLLSAMAGVGATRAAEDPRRWPLAVGGGLFFLSDLILAGELFRGLFFPHIGDTVWLTYLTGQGLIVAGLNDS